MCYFLEIFIFNSFYIFYALISINLENSLDFKFKLAKGKTLIHSYKGFNLFIHDIKNIHTYASIKNIILQIMNISRSKCNRGI